MDRAALGRRVLAELAQPRWEGKFGPSSWDLRGVLQREGSAITSAELLDLLVALRGEGLIRYQSPPGAARPSTVGNVRITAEGRAWLADHPSAGE